MFGSEDKCFERALAAVESFVASLDPFGFSEQEVRAVLLRVAKAEKLCGNARLLLTARTSQAEPDPRHGAGALDRDVAAATGAPIGSVRRDRETAEKLGSAPGLDEALRAGEISAAQAHLLASAIEADPEAAVRLVKMAEEAAFNILRDECERVKAAKRSEEKAQERERRLAARRHLRIWMSREGAVCLRGELAPVQGAVVKDALERAANQTFKHARRQGLRERHEAYMADALVDLCRTGYVDVPADSTDAAPEPSESCGASWAIAVPDGIGYADAAQTGRAGDAADAYADGDAAGCFGGAPDTPRPGGPASSGASSATPPSSDGAAAGRSRSRTGTPAAEIVIHVDAEALARGQTEGGERCEIKGVGPISLATLHSLLGNAWAKVVIEKGVDVLNVTHIGRVKRAHLETALRTRDEFCAVPGCGVSHGLEADHIIPICENGPTSLDNLVLLCHHHHQLKTRHFFRLSGPPGNRTWEQIKPLPGETNRQAGNGGKLRKPRASSQTTASSSSSPGPEASTSQASPSRGRDHTEPSLACSGLMVTVAVPDPAAERRPRAVPDPAAERRHRAVPDPAAERRRRALQTGARRGRRAARITRLSDGRSDEPEQLCPRSRWPVVRA